MPPNIASLFCAFLIFALFLLTRDRSASPSSSLWIPVVWLSIGASRMVSQWLGFAGRESPDQFVEGSPFDAFIFAGLLVLGLVVLFTRRRQATVIVRQNVPLLIFLFYCLLSTVWSDYPFVAIKRWIKALGDLVMILIVLTDPKPSAAIKGYLARPGFVLIPLSILLIRYYPTFGRGYSDWTGEAYNVGVATGKNGLGYVCLVFGLGSLWCFLELLKDSTGARKSRHLIGYGAILVLTLWLFQMAHSATSLSCFLIGASFMAAMCMSKLFPKPAIVHTLVGVVLFLALYGLLLNPGAGLVEAVGRDATLTGRTELWDQVLHMKGNSAFGVGYESFWLGDRLQEIWRKHWDHPNQAHNGYLEVYLDLGWIGVTLLALMMLKGYWNVIASLRQAPDIGRLRLSFFVVAAIYNLTEHAFRELHPVWIILLLAVTGVPQTWAKEGA